jgi:hypothetical protein
MVIVTVTTHYYDGKKSFSFSILEMSNNGSIRTHSLSVKLLEYGICLTLVSDNWRSLSSITLEEKDTKWVLYSGTA